MKRIKFIEGMFAGILALTNMTANAGDYNILDFGAVRNTLSTAAVQRAIDACSKHGGGTVIVPDGMFITGTIILKSNINLFLTPGSELRSSENLDDFRIASGHYGMIFCQDESDVSITGGGVINGLGSRFYETDQNHLYSEFDRKFTRQKEGYMPEGMFFTDGPLKRKSAPWMTIVFFHCTRVSVRDITVKDTPVWAIRFGYCEDVVVDGITILNNLMIPNSDGIHMTVSRNVRISDCDIHCGDDAIIVTGFARIEDTPGFNSKEQDKYTYGNKSIFAENIQVTNCHLQSRSAGIRVGYGQHPIRRCIFDNIVITGSNRGIGIFARDSSSIEELIFSNIIIETRLHNGQWWGNGEPVHLSVISRFEEEPVGKIKDVQFNNISATGEHGILIYGNSDSHMENIEFNNVRLRIKNGPETMGYGGNFDLRPSASPDKRIFEHDIPGIYAQYIDGLSIHGLTLSWGDDLPGFFTEGIECLEVKDLSIEDFKGTGNPDSQENQKIKLVNTTYRNNIPLK